MQVAQDNLEIAYHDTGYYDGRVAELRSGCAATPDDREARWELGRAYAALGQCDEAVDGVRADCSPARPTTCPRCCSSGWPSRAGAASRRPTAAFERAAELDPQQLGRAVLLRRGALQPRAQRAARQALEAAVAAQSRQRRRPLPAGLRLRRHGPARAGPRRDHAGHRAQPDPGAGAEQSVARALRRAAPRRARARRRRAPRAPAAVGRRGRGAGALQPRARLPAEGLLRRGAARVPAGARRRRGRPAGAAGDGGGAPAAARPRRRRSSCTTRCWRRTPASPKLWNERGVCLHQAGRRDEAATAYEQAIAADPDYALAWNNLGVLRTQVPDGDDGAGRLPRGAAAAARPRRGAAQPGAAALSAPPAAAGARGVPPGAGRATRSNAVAWNGVGLVLVELKRYEDAQARLRPRGGGRPGQRLGALQPELHAEPPGRFRRGAARDQAGAGARAVLRRRRSTR